MESPSQYPICQEIESGVYLVRGANFARFPEANCLLVDDEILTLVDAGASIEHIRAALHETGHREEDIQRIVISHFHIDHKGYANVLRIGPDCEVLCHPEAEPGIVSLRGMVAMYGIDGHSLYDDWVTRLRSWVPHITREYRVTGHYRDGVPIDCGRTQIYPRFCPGHTPDHTCFGIDGYDTMMLVDIDLTRFGPWYGNMVSDINDFKRSILDIMELGPTKVVTSHILDPVTQDVDLRLTQYLEVFDRREKRILQMISDGVDTIEKLTMAPTIYPRIPANLYYIFEEFMLRKHVEDLIERGAVRVKDDRLVVCQS
ncbi:MAG: MBL fold metallo-hydrolase [Candidatus Thorarchaeota archaeon]